MVNKAKYRVGSFAKFSVEEEVSAIPGILSLDNMEQLVPECRRRIDAIERGDVQTYSNEEVFRRLREKYKV